MAYFSFLGTSVIADFDDMVENQHKNFMSLFEMVDDSDDSIDDTKTSGENNFSNAEKENCRVFILAIFHSPVSFDS